MTAAPTEAVACSQGPQYFRFIRPWMGGDELPANVELLALAGATYDFEVHLYELEGVELEVEVTTEQHAGPWGDRRIRARPLEPLAQGEPYMWTVNKHQQMFVAGPPAPEVELDGVDYEVVFRGDGFADPEWACDANRTILGRHCEDAAVPPEPPVSPDPEPPAPSGDPPDAEPPGSTGGVDPDTDGGMPDVPVDDGDVGCSCRSGASPRTLALWLVVVVGLNRAARRRSRRS